MNLKKFKLKKWYPSLPKEMKVGDEVLFCGMFYSFRKCETFIPIEKNQVENNPEFWEEVKESEYIVIARDIFDCNINNIHSVRRLSDGELFTVGDKIFLPDSHMTRPEKITNILINVVDTPCLYTSTFCKNGINFKKAVKVKEPKIITEYGEQLFYGDEFYHIESDYEISKGFILSKSFQQLEGRKHFKTREAAEKWVDENKPVFSKKQLRNLLDTTYPEYTLKIPQIKALFKL